VAVGRSSQEPVRHRRDGEAALEAGPGYFKMGRMECPRIGSTDVSAFICNMYRRATIRAVFRDAYCWVVGERLAHAAGRLDDVMAETRYQ
jgi:hypothetical protein